MNIEKSNEVNKVVIRVNLYRVKKNDRLQFKVPTVYINARMQNNGVNNFTQTLVIKLSYRLAHI